VLDLRADGVEDVRGRPGNLRRPRRHTGMFERIHPALEEVGLSGNLTLNL